MSRLLVVLVLIGFAVPIRATVIIPAEFREIVAGSQLIVYGRVASLRSQWSPDRRRIDTVVSVEVGSYLKGGSGGTVTFRVPGGRIGRYRSITVGAPEFRAGEEAVFFLTSRGPGVARVFGMSQGVFRVRVDARTGDRLVVPPGLMAKGNRPERVTRGTSARQPLALQAFAVQVRAAMAQAGAGR